MLARTGVLAALVAPWPFSYGSTVSEDFLVSKRANQLYLLVSDSDVLDAFKAMGHPDAVPLQMWQDENGTTYQNLWTFDQSDWDAMHTNLLAEATGSNSTESLLPRQFGNSDHYFFCDGDTSSPFVYTIVISVVTGGICLGFHYSIGWAGRTQIIQRYDLEDVAGQKVKTTFKYLWLSTQFASSGTCAAAMQYGLTNACNNPKKNGKRALKGGEETLFVDPVRGTHRAFARVEAKRQ